MEDRGIRNEDNATLRSRTEEERQRRRREWQLQQERERQHERLKRQMILEYERKRARERAVKYTERKSERRGRSRNDSESPSRRGHRRRSESSPPKLDSDHETLDDSTAKTIPLFKGPEGTQISASELHRIKVNIHRNISPKGAVSKLQRDILNPEDVILKRREGEGCKPIFEREEIKQAVLEGDEVEERRTIIAEDHEQPVSINKSRTSKRRSSSSSPVRECIYHSGYPSSSQSRHGADTTHRSSRRSSSEKHVRECREKSTKRQEANRSRSRERDQDNSGSRSSLDEKSHREKHRTRSSERSREKRDRSMELRDVAPHYIEQIPVPIYYGNFPPRPIMVSPMVPFRGQVPPMGRGRHPALVRPFPPRFVPPDVYRMGPPTGNPRYGPMY